MVSSLATYAEQEISLQNFKARSTSSANLTGVLSAKLEQASTFGMVTIHSSQTILCMIRNAVIRKAVSRNDCLRRERTTP
jgi:hypothetical protein